MNGLELVKQLSKTVSVQTDAIGLLRVTLGSMEERLDQLQDVIPRLESLEQARYEYKEDT